MRACVRMDEGEMERERASKRVYVVWCVCVRERYIYRERERADLGGGGEASEVARNPPSPPQRCSSSFPKAPSPLFSAPWSPCGSRGVIKYVVKRVVKRVVTYLVEGSQTVIVHDHPVHTQTHNTHNTHKHSRMHVHARARTHTHAHTHTCQPPMSCSVTGAVISHTHSPTHPPSLSLTHTTSLSPSLTLAHTGPKATGANGPLFVLSLSLGCAGAV